MSSPGEEPSDLSCDSLNRLGSFKPLSPPWPREEGRRRGGDEKGEEAVEGDHPPIFMKCFAMFT